jgi:NADH-quinone oxidoreductase subunit A
MLNLLAFLTTTTIIVCIILVLTYLVNTPTNDYEKHSSYECGFEPFGDARSFFDIHFYTIGLLFIIFDLEIVFLIPFAINIESTSPIAYLNFILFMIILLVGFYYEWALGLLNWLPSKKFKRV